MYSRIVCALHKYASPLKRMRRSQNPAGALLISQLTWGSFNHRQEWLFATHLPKRVTFYNSYRGTVCASWSPESASSIFFSEIHISTQRYFCSLCIQFSLKAISLALTCLECSSPDLCMAPSLPSFRFLLQHTSKEKPSLNIPSEFPTPSSPCFDLLFLMFIYF